MSVQVRPPVPNIMNKMTYCVDIDNTILYSENSDYKNAIPDVYRIKYINKLYEDGHKIIYYTGRGARSGIDWHDFTIEQLKRFDCKYDELLMNKPHYDIWIDDKAIRPEEFFD